MKKVFFSICILLILLTSCAKEIEEKEEDSIIDNCKELVTNSNWTTENFKNFYSIQFPSDYEGSGMSSFEGNFFSKNKINDEVEFNYNYCMANFCFDFWDTLSFPFLDSVVVENSLITLNSKQTLCNKDSSFGVFYFNSDTNSTGILFMKQGGDYMGALTVNYNIDYYQEVEDVIRTISPR